MLKDEQELVFAACKNESCSALFLRLIQFRADVGMSQQALDLIAVLFNGLNVALLAIYLCVPSRCNAVIKVRLCCLTTSYFIALVQKLTASTHTNTPTVTYSQQHL